jgi:iron-sulfur cluster assembly accessory protein
MTAIKDKVLINESDEPVLKLTERAIIAVKEFMNEPDINKAGLRVGIRGGGCAGYQYSLDFSDPHDNDFKYTQDGLNIFVDPMSAMHLEGTIIDYVFGLSNAGFKFVNPNAKTTCGCGNSFI